MARIWMRIAMMLIFVFTTISAPSHTQTMAHPVKAQATATVADADMSGMSEECAKAMKVEATRIKAKHSAPSSPLSGCCTDGCNCPLSHCPATPPALASEIHTLKPVAAIRVTAREDVVLTSYLSGALKRPPRT